MNHQRLFHHPVSAMQAPARWYLAGVGVVALLLVAVHFAVQVQAQEHAQVLVSRWAEKTGMQVGHIRYHLLRNALRLNNVSIRRPGVSMTIGQVLLQADPASLLGSEPALRRVLLSSVQADVSVNGPKPVWASDAVLASFWSGARSLRASGELRLHLAAGKPLVLQVGRLQLENHAGHRTLELDARQADSVVRLEWQNGKSSEDNLGRVTWRNFDVASLAATFSMPAPREGRLAGILEWEPDRKHQGFLLNGETLWNDVTLSQKSLQWDGRVDADGWRFHLAAHRWPLGSWRDAIPSVAGRQVTYGLLTAEADVDGGWRPDSWHWSSAQGELDDVHLDDTRQGSDADWDAATVRYGNLEAKADTRSLSASRIEIVSPDVRIKPDDASDVQPLPGWTCNFPAIQLDELSLQVDLPRGMLVLPPLAGTASWKRPGRIALDLGQKGGDATSWQIKGHAEAVAGVIESAALSVRSADLPIGQLRPLLPIVPVAEADLPVALAGSAGFDLNAEYRDRTWTVQGSAAGENLTMAYAGEEWSAEKLTLDIDVAGPTREQQHVRSLEISGWRYIAPMQPLGSYEDDHTDVAGEPIGWWKDALRDGGWVFDRVGLSGGEVSIGRTDLRWARDVDISLQHVGPGKPSEIQVQALLGGGTLSARGKLEVLAVRPHFVGQVSLKDAQPFFLGDWLHASGAPRLIRGRMNATLQVSDTGDGHYQVVSDWRLRRPLVEAGAFPNDPLLGRIGFRTSDALLRLGDASGEVRLEVSFDGNWQESPLTLDRLGGEMLAAASERIQSPTAFAVAPVMIKPRDARVRMHENGGLTHNERVRLRTVWRQLVAHRDWDVDLVPRLPAGKIDAGMIRRTRFTQSLIETFFVERGIPRRRIFSVWPMPIHQVGEVGGIQVLAGASR